MMYDLFSGEITSEPKDGKVCSKCGIKQPLENFTIANGGNYRRTECTTCRRENASAVGRLRADNPYPDENYQCPICERTAEVIGEVTRGKHFVLDHCHTTKIFRGWLCDSCNRGLGGLKDDIGNLQRAIEYLRRIDEEG